MKGIDIQNLDLKVKEKLQLPPPHQIGMVVQDMDKAIQYYSELFGLGPWSVFTPNFIDKVYRGKPGIFEWRMASAFMGNIQLELIQVLKGPTIYQDDLGERGEGLHHLGFLVKNIDEKIKEAEKIEIRVVQSAERPETNGKWAYLDTRFIAGVTLEIIQRPYR